ncbi:heterokaryon incompatibility protein-domain-containing protein [Phialemonium atrogriseum]|uniref:Heterokaryon incompatibility protein-domain-containing protein n=1 Tax=Phialemonium atrogriseum TaxID=1093897 RepID=A0AAJ0C7U7_9PEZI|nr:heterokaryon incompatibility protein-domain-containing protein [Phialemonium atrogriseum]KAK1770269.1 heterokaryon incompatibility protein-domain-containing protein [Phialemonium atrogriseum]
MKYEYSQLSIQPGDPRGVFSIRLLHLLPSADPNARLQCQLVETQIADSQHGKPAVPRGRVPHAEYQALSYTWGEPVFPKVLHLVQSDGILPAGDINITENLHSALQNLRSPDRTLVLWVDAVCINQADIPERNSQVNNIPQTYTEAASVLVWLGTDSLQDDGRLCLDFFTELGTLIASDPAHGAEGSWRKRFKINQMVSTFLDSIQPRPIATFLTRPWFRRRWIVQEVVLARDVSIHCGAASIPWATFELSLMELFENDKGGFSEEHRTTLRAMSRIRHPESAAKRQDPLDTLVEFSSFVCANPRDRLFALYGAIQHWFPSSTPSDRARVGKVDYALSTGDVFTEFAILMMELEHLTSPGASGSKSTTHVIQLASAIKHPTRPAEGQEPGEFCGKIPSWVPDWTGQLSYEPLYHSPPDRDASAGIPTRPMEVLPPNNDVRLLISTGIVYDTVTAIIPIDIEPLLGAVYEAKSSLNAFLCAVARAFDATGFFPPAADAGAGGPDNNTYEPTGQHIVIALAAAIVANWEHTPSNSYFAQHPRFPGDFLEQLGSSRHHLPEIMHKWPAYVELVTITMRGRSLFLTAGGYVGVGAADILPGDAVCLLSGVRIPFVLRPLRGPVVAATAAAAGENEPCVPGAPGCYRFQDEEQCKEVVSKVWKDPAAHCTFRLMGDAYVHGLMEGEAAKNLGSRLDESLRILPIT